MLKTLCLMTIFLFMSPAHSYLDNVKAYTDPVDQQTMNGWHGPMARLKKQLNPKKNYVVAILHRPVNAFLMQDMYHFRSSVASSRRELKKDSIGKLGHFQVAWTCKLPGEKKRRVGMTGQTGENSGQGTQMLLDGGYGMSLFFATFTDGYLQSSFSQSERILRSSNSYGFDWVAFEISAEDCDYGLSYLDSYIDRRSYTNFSFTKKPEDFEGGGCTSFGSELFFQFGGASGGLVNKWVSKLLIPKSYLANPETSTLPVDTKLENWLYDEPYTRRRASIFSMAFLPNFSNKKKRITAEVYDTEKILYSIRELNRRALWRFKGSFPRGYKIPERKAFGLKADRSDSNHIVSGPRSEYVLVDEAYHKDFKEIQSYIDSKDIPKARIGDINGTPGAIFEKAAW